MRRKSGGGGEGGGDSWLNTYADMVTLLLTFFAVLLSMSTVNQEKYNAFIRSFSNLPPEVIEEITNPATNEQELAETANEVSPEAAKAMSDLYEKLVGYVEENGMTDTVSINKIDQVIFIKFDSSVFFEPDKYIMRQGGKETLSFIGDGIKEYETMINLVAICGHTATVPDNSNSIVSDWMLSGERAAIVAMFFEDEKAVDPQKMLLLGYGKNLPIATNDTEEGRMENRRVELVIVGADSNLSFDPYTDLNDLYDLIENEKTTSPTSDTNITDSSQTPASVEPTTPASEPAGEADNPNPDVQIDVSPYD